MKVCRVCLAMGVKMYHMPEHKLSDMYERVTGVQINLEDKLPKRICWECVARLSSANNFIEKALKTQWILLKKITGDNITMSDIASIDRAQYQLESALRLKYNEINITDLHIQRESHKYKDSVLKDVDSFTVKSELLDTTKQPEEAELQVPNPIIIIKENLSDDELTDYVSNASQTSEDENPAVLKDGEVCEAIKQESNDFGVTPLSNWSNDLLYNKELRVVLEDVMLNLRNKNTQDSFKEITNSGTCLKAQSIKNKETGTHPTFNKATLTNTNKMDTNSASTIEAAKCIYPGIGNITMSDIVSIDRVQYRLESTLGLKYYEVNNTDLHIKKESEITSDDHDASNVELLIVEYKDVENFTIKSELLDITEQPEEAELQVPKPIIIKENESDAEVTIENVSNASETSKDVNPAVREDREVCEAIKQEPNDFGVTSLSNRSNNLLYNKELRVVLEDVTLNLKNQNTQEISNSVTCLNAQSIKNKETGAHPTFNKATLTNNNNMDTDSASTIEADEFMYPGSSPVQSNLHGSSKKSNKTVCARTDIVKSDIDLTHYDVESSKKIFICDICKKSFQFKRYLKKHIQGHLFNCTDCRHKTCRKEYLTKHVNAKLTENNSFNCSYCDYKTYKKGNLATHINTQHTKNTVYNCSFCSYNAYDKSTLHYHVNATHTKNSVFGCSYCDYKAYKKSTLTLHINTKHTKNSVYNCSYCSYKAYEKSTLNYHVNATHTKNSVFDCSYCDYKAYKKSTLTLHINTKHTKNTVYNCSYCIYTTYSKSILNRHINAIHTKNTVFYCTHCDYKSCSKSTLSSHINSKHTKSTVYNCPYCSYKGYNSSNLNRHVNAIHTKNTVFYCAHCDYKSCSKSTLSNHINSKHTKSTVYNCL